MKSSRITNCLWVALSISIALLSDSAAAQTAKPIDANKARVADYWTSERRAKAIPRDLVIDARGLGYLRRPDGSLVPYGHDIAAQGPPGNLAISPFGKPGGGSGDATPPNARSGNAAASGTANSGVRTNAGGSGGTVTNAHWTSGGAVLKAAGRIYFEMPSNAKRNGTWWAYFCSGTVVNDKVTGRSVIITAAHCVYDDAHKAFARNVMFIPDQDGTTGSGTDLNCANDPMGCWIPSSGVVDVNWTTRIFPDNIAWDYAFYVVNDSGAHAQGINWTSDALDTAAGSLPVSFRTVSYDDKRIGAGPDFTHALGYSYSDDPNLMYCAQDLTTEGAVNWWLPSCELSGGSSGGPWLQPINTSTGSGSIISVNSWGYTNQPGMAGPKLVGTSASCVFTMAKTGSISSDPLDGDAGIKVTCP